MKRKSWVWVSLVSLLSSIFLLAGCGTITATPVTGNIGSGSLAAIPTVTDAPVWAGTPSSASGPVLVNNTPGSKPSVGAGPAKVAMPVGVVGSGSDFYQLPFANSVYAVHIPASLKTGSLANQPVQIVLTIHGMGGNGQDFATPLVPYADQHNLVLVAPNMQYDSNYFDPNHVATNDEQLLPQLHTLIANLPTQLHRQIKPKILLFGFSRGAQIVHRYAFFYPGEVLGVAAMSAGNYTLPEQTYRSTGTAAAKPQTLPFPFGVSDLSKYDGHNFDLNALQQVPFWLAVGGADNAVTDVPPAWSPYLGTTRIERATRFYQALQNAGIQATLTVVPGVGHTVCTQMKQGAFDFFGKLVG